VAGDVWKAPIAALKAQTEWLKKETREVFEVITVPVLQLLASGVNFAVARMLITVGRSEHSVVLEADGRHLMTDVWTSAGVILGVGLVAATGIERLDPAIALAVAANIVFTGGRLVRRSIDGLMDHALPADDETRIQTVLDRYASDCVAFHALRTRQAGRRSFMSVHVLVPGSWSVHEGHAFLELVERDLRSVVPSATVFTHLEPIEDAASFADVALER